MNKNLHFSKKKNVFTDLKILNRNVY